jgi:superfamily II DNA or RNA helicase
MEPLLLETPEIEARRAQVASFIQDNLQPAKHALEKGVLNTLSEEVINFEIKDHQLDAWGAIWDARQAGADRALVHMATGLGKTSVAVFDVIKFSAEFSAEHGREPRVLFACHQNEILEQAAKRFEAFTPDLSQGFYTGDSKVRDADVTFATLQSLYGSLDTFDSEGFDYIIYDEAHHSKAETFEEVVNYFMPRFQLALTATPDRLDGLDIRELFDEEVYSKGLAQALAEELLVKPDYHVVFDDAVKEAMETDFTTKSLRELRDLLDIQPRNELIAENIKREVQKLGLELGKVKTIVFCHDIMHTEDMAELLGAQEYHSLLPAGRRREILQKFRSGDLQTICVRDMFNEGIDIPDAQLLVFLRSTSSATVFEQQLGRGLRQYEGKDKVSVLDFAANIERILMIKDLMECIEQYTLEPFMGSNGSDLILEEPEKETDASPKGQFAFDRLSVDLLSKYDELQFDPAPEGYVSINGVAAKLDIHADVIRRWIKEYEIETEKHRFFTASGTSLGPQAQAKLQELYDAIPPKPPEGYVSAYAFAETLNMTDPTVKKVVRRYGIETEIHNFSGKVGMSLGPEAQARLQEINESLYVAPPEGYVSIKRFAKELGIHKNTLQSRITEHGIRTETYRFTTVVTSGLSPKSQEELRRIQAEYPTPAPEGYESVSQFTRKTGIDRKTLGSLVTENEIEIEQHTFAGNTGASLSPAAQTRIKEIIDKERGQEAPLSPRQPQRKEPTRHKPSKKTSVSSAPRIPLPEGYVSAQAFARELGTHKYTLRKRIEDHEVETEVHMFGGRPGRILSPEAQTQLKKIYERAIGPPPEDYRSMASMAKSFGMDRSRLQRIIRQNEIETERHRFGGAVGMSLSPEAQEKLTSLTGDYVRPKLAPAGYVSVSGLARTLHAAPETLAKLIAEHEIEIKIYEFGGSRGRGLSPSVQEELTQALRVKRKK